MIDRGLLARFLACDVPPDVRSWVVSIAIDAMAPTERREQRDRMIRAAGELVPGARWTAARRLHAIARELAGALPAAPDTTTVRGCVAAALLLSPGRKPPSILTLHRIIAIKTD